VLDGIREVAKFQKILHTLNEYANTRLLPRYMINFNDAHEM
jgi:hypothetical protein